MMQASALAPPDPCKLHDRQDADDDDRQCRNRRFLVGATRRLTVKMGCESLKIQRPQQEGGGKFLDAIDEDQQGGGGQRCL